MRDDPFHEAHLPLDACDHCAHRPVEYRCAECGLQLCAAHHDVCPECDEGVFGPSGAASMVSPTRLPRRRPRGGPAPP
jgi:hypothetical protein